MKKLSLVGLSALLASMSASAVSLDGKFPVCVSEDAYTRLSAILKHDDQEAFKAIMTSECFMPKDNLPVEKLVSMGEWGNTIAHVKIYHKGKLYDLWTDNRNVKAD